MKQTMILIALIIFVAGCTAVKDKPEVSESLVSGTQELILNEQELSQLGMVGDQLKQLAELGLTTDGSDCKTEEYNTTEFSPLMQYSICSYVINSLNDTEVIIEFKKFTNGHDLNGTFQYESLHYRSVDGLISENEYGDQSRFYLANKNDYGGEFNNPDVYIYTLYMTKDQYLIHVTSKGRIKEAKEVIEQIGKIVMSRFG